MIFSSILSLSIRYHQRIINSEEGEICDCIFAFFYWSASGGAIFISSGLNSLSLLDSCFRSCVTTQYGGAAFLNSLHHLEVNNCCYEVCYVHNRSDSTYGNSMYINSTEIEFNKTASLMCGPYKSISGDCNHHFITSKISAETLNSTSCFSNMGSSAFGISALSNTEGNLMKHLNIVYGAGQAFFENFPSPMSIDVCNSNFINTTTGTIFYSTGILNIINSFVWTFTYSLITNDASKVKLINCIGNIEGCSGACEDDIIMVQEKNADFCGIADQKVHSLREKNHFKIILICTIVCWGKSH